MTLQDRVSVTNRAELETYCQGHGIPTGALLTLVSRVALRVAHAELARFPPGGEQKQSQHLSRALITSNAGALSRTPAIAIAADVASKKKAGVAALAAAAVAEPWHAGALFQAAGQAAERAATPDIWQAISDDLEQVSAGCDLRTKELWLSSSPLAESSQKGIKLFGSLPGGDFWIDWYQRALDGRPQNWPLLRDVALIDNALWEQGGEALDAEITRLVGSHGADDPPREPHPNTPLPIERLMRSALADYRFDQIANLMRMVPFAEDIRHLSDPEILGRFLADAADMVRALRTFHRAISAEAGRLQGAGWIATYLDEVLKELEDARNIGRLNVGVIVEYGAILQGGADSKDVNDEFGSLAVPFRAGVEKLRALTISYFAHAYVREAPLKQIRSDPETSLSDLLEDLRQSIDAVKKTDPNQRVPLAPPDIEVFDALYAELERQVRAEFLAAHPEMKSKLRQETDFLMAKLGLSLALYAEDGRKALNKVERVAGFAGTIHRGFGALESLLEWLKALYRV